MGGGIGGGGCWCVVVEGSCGELVSVVWESVFVVWWEWVFVEGWFLVVVVGGELVW